MITAIVLAAGISRRMGEPKMALPWGDTTILGQVLRVLVGAGVEDILVVTGGAQFEVQGICHHAGARTVPNPEYEAGEMLSSLQVGLRAAPSSAEAALVVLGDQPRIEPPVVEAVIRAYAETGVSLILPSFQRRRGHPWLVGRELWPRLLEMRPPETPREFLHRRSGIIHYVEVDTPSILEDIDTPEDYLKSRP